MRTNAFAALGALLTLSAGCSLMIDPDSVAAPDGGPPVCGNDAREGLEGCDDGNLQDGDGCSSQCVYELVGRLPFATVTYNGLWMTVTPSGIIYMDVDADGSGSDTITRVDPDGTVHPDIFLGAVPGVFSHYGGDVIAVGEDLVLGGSTSSGTQIQRWAASTGAMSTLLSIPTVYFQIFAANSALDRVFYAGNGSPGPGPVYKMTSPMASAPYSATPVNRLLYDQARDRLYAITSGGLAVDSSGGVGATGTFSPLFPSSELTDVAIDGEGTLYVVCKTAADLPCTPGAVIAVDPAGALTAPFVSSVSSSAIIRAIGYDAAANELVLVSAGPPPGQIFRVPLAR